MAELPPLDAFGTLVFQVTGQQLSVTATRTILSASKSTSEDVCRHRPSCSQRIRKCYGPAASQLQGRDATGAGGTVVNGRLSDNALARMTDDACSRPSTTNDHYRDHQRGTIRDRRDAADPPPFAGHDLIRL
jgi:hypothetical protein